MYEEIARGDKLGRAWADSDPSFQGGFRLRAGGLRGKEGRGIMSDRPKAWLADETRHTRQQPLASKAEVT